MYKKLIFSFLTVFVLIGIARFCHYQTKGFRLSKLYNNTSDIASCPIEIPPFIKDLLTQKFTYLDRGLQSFCFLSEDKQTVLKIFNNHYQKRLFWLSTLKRWTREGPFSFLSSYLSCKIAYNQKKWRMTFESYQIANDHLKEEAALLFFHPTASKEPLHVNIVDCLQITHLIPLNQMAFVLQKKATLLYPFLSFCTLAEGRTALTSLVDLLKGKMEKGIGDRDPLLRKNVGFIEGKAVQIDIGPLFFDKHLKKSPIQKAQLEKNLFSLKQWLENHHPDLVPYLHAACD